VSFGLSPRNKQVDRPVLSTRFAIQSAQAQAPLGKAPKVIVRHSTAKGSSANEIVRQVCRLHSEQSFIPTPGSTRRKPQAMDGSQVEAKECPPDQQCEARDQALSPPKKRKTSIRLSLSTMEHLSVEREHRDSPQRHEADPTWNQDLQPPEKLRKVSNMRGSQGGRKKQRRKEDRRLAG